MQKIITEKIGGKVILLLQEDLDTADQRLTRCLPSLCQAAPELSVWIDCSSLECIKAYGFCHFVNQLLVLKSYGISVTLLHLSRQQQQLLRLLQVDALVAVVPDVAEAYQLAQAS
ncbi:STAS domain-containing protein [Rufibacter sp. XAAS-G3-1]|uniref:STAS domain-containing protein n=1 Tax=Rufibacter sp. XAAS-G3-1 TaxID=2729134 RepID=UPI0015E67627|nr:STAS domain-containing protein [Rufibacter sp. XAAS-G3-1]